jgi:hypothetical protein
MSENNNPELIIAEPEVVEPSPFDFEFIANALGLIPYQAWALDDEALPLDDNTTIQGAFNLGAIINVEVTEDGGAAFTLHGSEEILMSRDHLAAFESVLKEKVKENQARQREALLAMQGGVQPGMIVGTVPTGKRFRQ